MKYSKRLRFCNLYSISVLFVKLKSVMKDEADDVLRSLISEHPGLTTRDALKNLYDEICKFKNNRSFGTSLYFNIIKKSFRQSSYDSTFSWIPVIISLSITLALLCYTSSRFGVTIILFLTVVNVLVVYWNNYLRFNEFQNRLDYILKTLKRVKRTNNWQLEQFPNLYTPNSPSVSLQWTIRNGQLVNLPSILLAKGDIIVMRPGQLSPADAETVYPPPSSDNKHSTLVMDQLFGYEQATNSSDTNDYQSVKRPSAEDKLYVVKKAPYITYLRAVTDIYLERPTSLYDKARYLLFGKCLYHTLLPICFVISIVLVPVRWFVFPSLRCKSCSQHETWANEITSLLIPLLSLAFPVSWFMSNAAANALLLSRYSFLVNKEEKICDDESKDVSKSENSYLRDIELSFQSFSESPINTRTRQRNNFWTLFVNFMKNKSFVIVRCTNFVHTMASVTVFCCVDKKGVLSFPNPIAEKVFFIKNFTQNGEMKDNGARTVTYDNEDTCTDGNTRSVAEEYQNDKSSKSMSTTVEILDITSRDEKGSAWKIEFDDSRWRCYLSSLKPLGLAILVNTCNKKTHKTYNDFCACITSRALQNKHLVPVANRRCMCELARQIGFHEFNTERKYNLEFQLFTYKNLAETHAGNKYVKAIFKTRKPKFPFPHAMSVIVSTKKHKSNEAWLGSKRNDNNEDERKPKRSIHNAEENQMFSQGTADVILDYCVDYWDGYDVHPLTPGIRKKILDFYQRCSLTAYCTAFSYRPVHKFLRKDAKTNSNLVVYAELMENFKSLSRRKPKRRRRRQRHEICINERKIQLQQFMFNESVPISAYSSVYWSNMKRKTDVVALQEVSECDEDLCDNFGDGAEKCEEAIDCTNEKCENLLKSGYYGVDSDEDEDECEDDDLDPTEEFSNFCGKRDRTFEDEQKKAIANKDQCGDYFQILSKQIFLGMVSMQYQPLIDMVQMIEELEKACIRFVHFSKENELRSRVFSEKMGLESGWNCHISLLPDCDSTQLVEGFGNGGIPITTDLEISSTVETGASSADDEENVPFSFDMSNRAKLPCGIQNIRPHLEKVDNVPLLVSLFTDCTPDTTEQMLTIMQEYGQVVCILGSAANVKNFSLFARADASISVEPLYAQVCQQIPSPSLSDVHRNNCLSPIELSHLLNSFPCSLTLQRNYSYHRILPIHPLIAESRNIMRNIWNCFQFWLCCITLTFAVQFLTLLFPLPAIFTLEQTLWISMVLTPCLSISLTTARYDEDIMTKAKGKDWLCSINWTTIKYAIVCYGTKLLWGVITTLISYLIELILICNCVEENSLPTNASSINASQSTPSKICFHVFFANDSVDKNLEAEYATSLNIVRYHMLLILSLNLVALCISFLQRDFVFWKRIPRLNLLWLLLVFSPFSLQLIHFIVIVNQHSTSCLQSDVTLWCFRSSMLTFFSSFLTYLISEIVKIYEIRVNERYQKKVRLEFGTKLGMNSPF